MDFTNAPNAAQRVIIEHSSKENKFRGGKENEVVHRTLCGRITKKITFFYLDSIVSVYKQGSMPFSYIKSSKCVV